MKNDPCAHITITMSCLSDYTLAAVYTRVVCALTGTSVHNNDIGYDWWYEETPVQTVEPRLLTVADTDPLV